jgi:hypothetical protein
MSECLYTSAYCTLASRHIVHTFRHSGLYVYNIDSRYKYFMSRFYNFYKICKVIVLYGLQVSSESYVLVFYIGTHLMMARESRNM